MKSDRTGKAPQARQQVGDVFVQRFSHGFMDKNDAAMDFIPCAARFIQQRSHIIIRP
jgi:hypothetical protein